MSDHISEVVSPDAPKTTNEQGGSQSLVKVRFDLIDGPAMFQMASVLYEGAEKYGENNWRKIDISDHLNHLIMHAYAYLSGDRNDAHLSHIMCRAMFAQAVDITNKQISPGDAALLENERVLRLRDAQEAERERIARESHHFNMQREGDTYGEQHHD